jgi:double-stranded uracil-DNA glycosylase
MSDLALGFPPVGASQPRLLILGSLPGQASLQAQQYYAHPRNAFWPIMAELLGFDPTLAYPARLAELSQHHIALWDVLQSAERSGSLDQAIVSSSQAANPLDQFLAQPQLRAIACNGALAAKLLVQSKLCSRHTHIELLRLPSTSPAHAALSFDKKLRQWRTILDYLKP